MADGPYPELSERKPETCISTTLHPLRHLKGLSLFKGTQTHIVRIIRLRAQILRSRQYRAIFRIPDRRRKKFAFSEFSPHAIFSGRKGERPKRENSGATTRDKLSPTSLAPFICAGKCASPHRWPRGDSHSLQPRQNNGNMAKIKRLNFYRQGRERLTPIQTPRPNATCPRWTPIQAAVSSSCLAN